MKISKLFCAIAFLLFLWNQYSIFAQRPSDYSNVSRQEVQENLDLIDLNAYRFSFFQDNFFIADINHLKERKTVTIQILDQNLERLGEKSIVFDPNIFKSIKDYTLRGMAFNEQSAYFLFGLFLIQVENFGLNNEIQRIFKLEHSYQRMYLSTDGIWLWPNNRSLNEPVDFISHISFFDGKKDRLYRKFPVDNYYYLHFDKRNLYYVTNSSIYFLSPDQPFLEIYNFSSNESKFVQIHSSWDNPSKDDSDLYKRIAAKDPHKLFSTMSKRMSDDLSSNLRIEGIDSNHVAISYVPGVSSSNHEEFENRMHIWRITPDSAHFVKPFKITSPYQEYVNEAGELEFGFPDYTEVFFYKNAVRYQLAIEPVADWSDKNAVRIKKEREKSMLNNKFVLCVYKGELKL